VHASPGVGGGYRLGAGAALPPLLLDDDEAVAVAIGLRTAAAGSVTDIQETSLRALAKLEQVLPSRLRHRVNVLQAATVEIPAPGPTVDPEVLTVIAGACRDQELLRFDYQARDGDASIRRVEPHRLVYTGRRWYLLAWDRDREDWRTFRADRITPRLPTGPRFAAREPPDDAARHVVRGTASLAWAHPARVRLLVPVEAVAEHVPPAAGLLRPVDRRSCILETGGDTLDGLVRYLTGLDVPFQVLDPPELRDRLRRLAQRYAAAAHDPTGADPG
jgi:predicted DNA-binding transcriptional regulator YafY